MKKIAFQTFGCKLNYSETSSISSTCKDMGFEIVDYKDHADIYVVNTCTVTATAEKKSILAARQAKSRNSESKVILVGCLSQLKADELLKRSEIDLVLGSNEKFNLPNIISETYVIDKEEKLNNSFISSFSSGDRTRSFLKIQDGCDYFCTYCAIPHARGRSRSDSIESVLKKIEEIAEKGIQEIVLTGVNVGDFGNKTNESFFQLLKSINEQKVIKRLRLSSVEPDLLNYDIIDLVATSNIIMPHFHIPLQSGSNGVLKRMHRKYPAELFADKVKYIKTKMPFACIAADVITGFPGETEEEFSETFNLIDASEISYLHVFPYSERKGTVAAEMPLKVNDKDRHHRTHQLLKLSDVKKNTFYQHNKAKTFNVLFESDNEKGFMSGFSDNYIRVKVPYNAAWVNAIQEVTLDEIDRDGVFTIKNI